MNLKKSKGLSIILGLLIIVILVFLDQWTKVLAVQHLAGQEDLVLIPGILNLHYLENRGAAFGILQNQQTLFIVITSLFLLIPAAGYILLPRTRHMLPLRLVCLGILAGGIGNLIDRVRQGFVVDFFETAFMNFPVFNVADIYVTVSFFILILLILFKYKEEDFTFFTKERKEKEA